MKLLAGIFILIIIVVVLAFGFGSSTTYSQIFVGNTVTTKPKVNLITLRAKAKEALNSGKALIAFKKLLQD